MCNTPDGRELAMARWGTPSPPQHLITRTGKPMATDAGVTNARNVGSPHWRRWLGMGSR
jgi:putative SOS response-associated peptidase YedK